MHARFSWQAAPRPILALAPMAGVTDASYRQLIKTLAPETVVYTELLSTNALAYKGKKTMGMMSFDPSLERPFIVQLFGKEARHFVEAAKVVEAAGADGIDINMGCPAAKVVSSCHGAALIKKPELAVELVLAARKAVTIPVSVKTRLGWDSADTLVSFCRMLEDAGAAAIAVHGRTYKQQFKGDADWMPIYALKNMLKIPVIGNGDIHSAQDALDRLQNLDGVMIGRATFGNPWLMGEIAEAFRTGKAPVSASQTLTFPQKIPFILEHCALAVKTKGERKGMLEMRRHLSGYVKGFDGASEMRQALMKVDTFEETKRILLQE